MGENITEGLFEKTNPRESRQEYISRIQREVRGHRAMRNMYDFSVYQKAFFGMLGKNVAQLHTRLCENPEISVSELIQSLPGQAGVIPDSIWSEFRSRAESLVQKAHLIRTTSERYADKKKFFQYLMEQRLEIPGPFKFFQRGCAGVFLVGRESTFRSLEKDLFQEIIPTKTDVKCGGYVVENTSLPLLRNCIIVLRADGRGNDIESLLKHEMKHVFFGSLFPDLQALSCPDRSKDEIIAYLDEHNQNHHNPVVLHDIVIEALRSYVDEIFEGIEFESATVAHDYVEKYCATIHNMVSVGAQMSRIDPNFWVTLMILPSNQWVQVLSRVYGVHPHKEILDDEYKMRKNSSEDVK